MQIEKIENILENPINPRQIKKEKFDKLINSVRTFPDMLNKRPLVVYTNEDGKYVVLGGNMRLKACRQIGLKEIPIIIADEWTEEQRNEFLIKDNVSFGEWEWDTLANEWDTNKLDKWGLDLPKISETEKLSALEFEDIYYKPINKPEITLINCVDLTKFNAKKEFILNSNLSEEMKNVLLLFAYRFIKIDFESVANYYYFNAGDEEKTVIERLRLVLCDNGVNGFIEDDILRIHELLNEWNDD